MSIIYKSYILTKLKIKCKLLNIIFTSIIITSMNRNPYMVYRPIPWGFCRVGWGVANFCVDYHTKSPPTPPQATPLFYNSTYNFYSLLYSPIYCNMIIKEHKNQNCLKTTEHTYACLCTSAIYQTQYLI